MTPDVEAAPGGVVVSVVVPVLDHGAHLAEVCGRVTAALAPRWPEHEVIFVDDGSSDDSWAIMTHLATRPGIRALRLARNSGQTAALCAGIGASQGDVIVTIDADLDTYPEDIPLLVDAVLAGADVANGCRQGRDWRRRLPSRFFNWRLRRMGLPYADGGSGMFAMRAAIAAEALHHGEMRRGFRLKLLLAALGQPIEEVPVRSGSYRPSHHRMADLLSGWFEVEVAERRTALIGVATFGAVVGALGAAGAVAAAIALAAGRHVATIAIGLVIIALLGAILTTLGIVANLSLRAFQHGSTPFYRVVETAGRGTATAEHDHAEPRTGRWIQP